MVAVSLVVVLNIRHINLSTESDQIYKKRIETSNIIPRAFQTCSDTCSIKFGSQLKLIKNSFTVNHRQSVNA